VRRFLLMLLALLAGSTAGLGWAVAQAQQTPESAPAETPAASASVDSDLLDEGRRVYRTKCVICHGRQGGRGPNLFRTGLDEAAFTDTVLHGRKGTVMPAFSGRLDEAEIAAVLAYVRSTDELE
jgi:cytochrome c oxidase subunit 2